MKTSVIVPTALLVMMVITISLLPVAIKHFAIGQAHSMGMGELKIENVDFNPFTLELVIEDYELTHERQRYLTGRQLIADLVWLDLFKGRIGIEKLALIEGEFWARESIAGQWSLLPPVAATPSDEPEQPLMIEYALDSLAIADTVIHIEGQLINGDFELPNLSVNDLANFDAQTAGTTTSISGNWGDARITIDAHKELMAVEPPFDITIELTSLALADFQQLVGLPRLEGLLDATIEIRGNLSRPPLIASSERLDVSATADISVTATDLIAHDPADVLRTHASRVTWLGRMEAGVDVAGLRFLSEGDLVVTGASAMHGDTSVAGWNELKLLGARVDSTNEFSIDQLTVSGLSVFETNAPVFQSQLSVRGLSVDSQQSIKVDQIALSDFVANLTVTADGSFDFVPPSLNEAFFTQNDSNREQDTVQQADPLKINLTGFTANGLVHFTDHSVTPGFAQQLVVDEFKVGEVNSVSSDQETDIRIRTRLDEYTRLDIDASTKVFAPQMDVTSTINLSQLPLDKMTAYLERAIGYEANTGQMDLRAGIDIKDQHVTAELDLLLRKFRVNRVKGSDVDGALGMPLGAALSLVRDSDDNIKLEGVKIKGDLNDPSVSARQLVTKALSKALLAGGMTYFNFALQPYGAALMAAQAIGKQASKVKLDPLQMQPLNATVSEQNADYIDKLVELMNERPQLHLVLCGEASTAVDRSAPISPQTSPETTNVMDTTTNQQPLIQDDTLMLMQLADDRSRQVKALMYGNGIGSDRLLICKSRLNDEPDGARVVMSLE